MGQTYYHLEGRSQPIVKARVVEDTIYLVQFILKQIHLKKYKYILVIVTWPDDEEEFGCYTVYVCKRCDDSKPRKDSCKSWDASKMEEVFCETCKDCREKGRERWQKYYTSKQTEVLEKRKEYKTNYNQLEQLEVFCDYC